MLRQLISRRADHLPSVKICLEKLHVGVDVGPPPGELVADRPPGLVEVFANASKVWSHPGTLVFQLDGSRSRVPTAGSSRQAGAEIPAVVEAIGVRNVLPSDAPEKDIEISNPRELVGVHLETVDSGIRHFVEVLAGQPHHLVVGTVVTPGFVFLPGVAWDPNQNVGQQFNESGAWRRIRRGRLIDRLKAVEMAEKAGLLGETVQLPRAFGFLSGSRNKVSPAAQRGQDYLSRKAIPELQGF